MSLLDKFRAQLYEKDEEDIDMDQVALGVSSFADAVKDPFSAAKYLITALFIEAAAIACVVFGSRLIGELLYNEFALLIFLVLPFATGAAIAYSTYRLFQFSFRTQIERPSVDSGMMSGYAEYDLRQRNGTIWFVTAFGGIANSLLLFLLYSMS